MRLGRIASPDGVAFVSIEGPTDDPAQAVAREIAEHPFGTPTSPGVSGRWPTSGCWRRSWPARWSASARTTPRTSRRWAAEIAAEPLMFLKPNTAIIGPNVPIQMPADADPVHYEGELAVVIGRLCRDVPASSGRGEHPRLHDRQRRDRARPAEEGRPVDPRQGLRHVLPARPVDRDRPRPVPTSTIRTEVNGDVKQDGRTR